jgi:hypothetical protein
MALEIVHSEKNNLVLSSGLSVTSFGKTNMGTLLDEQGWIAEIHTDIKENVQSDSSTGTNKHISSILFKPYTFTETRTEDDSTVVFCGPEFTGLTLHAIFEAAHASASDNSSPVASSFAAVAAASSFAAVATLTAAIEQHISLAPVGIGGILYRASLIPAGKKDTASDTSCAEVLFLPGTLFDRCALNTSDNEYSELQGRSIRHGIYDSNALAFTRAVIAYRSLCGAMPYTQPNTELRQADMIDASFTPCELIVNGISKETADAIDDGLKITGARHAAPGERIFKSKKEEAREAAEKNTVEHFPINIYRKELMMSTTASTTSAQTDSGTGKNIRRTLELPPDLFEARRTRYLAKRRVTINLNRFTRRNRNQILATIATVIVATAVARGFHKENEKLATSIGLTPSQTVETLYTGINRADVTIVQEIAKGSKMKDLIQMVSGFYVTAKQRQSLDQENVTVTPAEWMFFKGDTNFWMYGITNFAVGGNDASTSYKYPTRKNHFAPLTSQVSDTAKPASPLKNGATVTQESSYYFVHSDSDYRININRTTDTVTLTWKKNRWVATNITGTSENSVVNTKTFRADYKAALEAAKTAAHSADSADATVNEGACIASAVESLRVQYPWLPRKDELRAGAESAVTSFNSSAAKEYLNN